MSSHATQDEMKRAWGEFLKAIHQMGEGFLNEGKTFSGPTELFRECIHLRNAGRLVSLLTGGFVDVSVVHANSPEELVEKLVKESGATEFEAHAFVRDLLGTMKKGDTQATGTILTADKPDRVIH